MTTIAERKLELVDELVRRLQARFGPGIIYRLSKASPKVGARVLSTGSLGLDRASRIGGVPRGGISVYQGSESSGKTTLASCLLAEGQRDGGLVALIDGEGAADPTALRACGVDLDDVILASPRDATEAFEMVEILVRCRALDAVVATALPPSHPGFLARALRRLGAWLKEAPTAVVFVRGDSERVLLFAASVVIDFQLVRPLFGPGGDLEGLRARAVVAKNRLAAPGGVAELDVLRGRGLDRAAEALAWGEALGLVERRPQGFVWEGVFLGRSRMAAQAELETDPELATRLAQAVRRG